MATLSTFDLANHWPFIERNLLLTRTPAISRALAVLAAEQVEHGGEPVGMRRALLERPYGPPGRERPATPGEVGNAWRALVELQERGVVDRYPGRGRRPALWHFRPEDFGRRWKMPWAASGRRVALVVQSCRCVAVSPLVARIAGQDVGRCRDSRAFQIEPGDHLVFRGPNATQTRQTARLIHDDLGLRYVIARQEGPPIPLPGSYSVTTPLQEEEELETEAAKRVARAITELTGAPLYGSPRRRLATAMAAGQLDPGVVIAELRRMPAPSFRLCVARVEELAEDGPRPRGAEASSAAAAERRRLERLVEEYQEEGNLEEAAFYRSRLVAVGAK